MYIASMEVREWDEYIEGLFEVSKEMMSTRAPPLPLSFETWCSRVRRAPQIAPISNRSGTSSTDTHEKFVPDSVGFWGEFPSYVAVWKEEMVSCGLREAFPHFAREDTCTYTTGSIPRGVICNEPSTAASLQMDYFNMINDFNLSFYQLFESSLPPLTRQSTEVFTQPRVACMRLLGNPDVIITDGTDSMEKVGCGEIKTPWVLRPDAIQDLFQRIPFDNFGRDYIAPESLFEPFDSREAKVNLGKAITQLYHDLLSDSLTLGFLATTDRIIYCFIPPENRSHLEVFMNPIFRQERMWNQHMPEERRFTAQVGLATLAWLGKRFYATPRLVPDGLKIYGYWKPRRGARVPEERTDPTYQPGGSTAHPRQSSRGRILRPMTNYPEYCTALCLKALKQGSFHADCPNAESHKGKKFTVDAVIDDVLESVRLLQAKVVGGGNSAKCVAVRSETYGHGVIVKLYNENTEQYLYKRELEVYKHLLELQGVYIPVVLGAVNVPMGSFARMIIMSYGGVPLHCCSPNDELIEELTKAAVAICAHGVVVDDSSTDNVLVNDNKVTVIDFESAFLVDTPSAAVLQQYKAEIESIAEKVKVTGNLKALLP